MFYCVQMYSLHMFCPLCSCVTNLAPNVSFGSLPREEISCFCSKKKIHLNVAHYSQGRCKHLVGRTAKTFQTRSWKLSAFLCTPDDLTRVDCPCLLVEELILPMKSSNSSPCSLLLTIYGSLANCWLRSLAQQHAFAKG